MIRSLVQLPPLEDIIETINYVDPNETQDRNDMHSIPYVDFFISCLWLFWRGRCSVFAEMLTSFGIFRLWPG